MREYLLVVRRNPRLAEAEIDGYLAARRVPHEVGDVAATHVVLRSDDFKPAKAAEELGASVKIAELLAHWDVEEAQRLAKSERPLPLDHLGEFYDVRTVGVSLYADKGGPPRGVAEALRDLAARQVADLITSQTKKKVGVVIGEDPEEGTTAFSPRESRRKGFHEDNVEVVVTAGPEGVRVGRVVGVCDQAAFDRRGVDRPSKPGGWIYGMAPPLARCLVNLARARPGATLLDPFCGIGTVLQEAMLLGVNVVGSDVDPEAVRSAEANLKFVQKEFPGPKGSFRLSARDARETGLKEASVDCVATEPFLGPGFQKRPSREEANRVLGNLRPLFAGSLEEMARVLRPGGSATIVFPEIEVPNGDVAMDVAGLLATSGLRLRATVLDRHPNQVVARRFVIARR